MALLSAVYMGFNQVYLLGCDHDTITHLNISKHFDEEKELTLVRKGYDENYQPDLEACCRGYIQLWQQYKAICAILAKTDNRTEIFNATPESYLNVFSRVRFDSLFLDKTAVLV